MDKLSTLNLTAEIVSAHVSKNNVAANDLPAFIAATYNALANAGQVQEVVVGEKLEPAVSIRSSVKNDVIICLECGRKFKSLKRHLTADHNLGPAAYRLRWGLKDDYPFVAPAYAQMRREMAIKIGLGSKRSPKAGRPKKSG